MRQYLLRRALASVPLLLGISVVIFAIIHLPPGGPMAVYGADPRLNPADLALIEQRLGVDRPLPVQYARWFRAMLAGDWGESYKDHRPVTAVIRERVPATLELMLASVLIAAAVAVPAGVYLAVSRRPTARSLVAVLTVLGMSVPTFWLGLIAILVFSVRLDWMPAGGRYTIGAPFSAWDRLQHLVLPALTLSFFSLATWTRFLRSSMLEVANQDFVLAARAKGLRERVVTRRHALRNALIPLITVAGIDAPRLFSGALVTEVIFSWPGIGRLITESLLARDYPVLMGCFLIAAVLVVLGNLVADVGYAVADPRIRYA